MTLLPHTTPSTASRLRVPSPDARAHGAGKAPAAGRKREAVGVRPPGKKWRQGFRIPPYGSTKDLTARETEDIRKDHLLSKKAPRTEQHGS
ncbi:hypothetical protein GCM10010274_15840 [Streptomyces lavendofoliae]|uniref:Uncharacterized protein n=1 Tax=Streptomyces lavendofoliae TaxID=67314 RepID=A0A918M2Q6_9ACTN|nr:hypothetical protein GCM10010274_15840 [Streptomyces lavendofoliae]